MHDFRCDICRSPTAKEQPSRRWENIVGDIGLEVVILDGNSPICHKHICDNCILDLFWARAERYHFLHPVIMKRKELTLREKKCEEMEEIMKKGLGDYNEKMHDADQLDERLKILKSDIYAAERMIRIKINDLIEAKPPLKTVQPAQKRSTR